VGGVRTSEDRLETFCASPTTQLVALALATFVAGYAHWHNDGLWFQGDAPRHAANGLFLLDLVRFLPSDPMDFALSYYARYPIIVPVAYPPLFSMLEAVAFGSTTASPFIAKGLVWGFTVLTAVYTMVWARRRLAPFAGWAGVCVVLMPSMLKYSNAVLLNVPSTALSIAALYHFQQWLDHNAAKDRRWFLLMAAAALVTYYPSGLILPIAMVWMMGSKRVLARSSAVWVAVGILGILVLVVDYTLPVFSGRMSPALSRWLNPTIWTQTLRNVVRVIGWGWLPIAALGVAMGLTHAGRRSEALRLTVAFPTVIVVLVIVPAASDRYALLLAPLAMLASFLGLVICVESAGRWRREVLVGGLVALLAWAGTEALRTRVPEAAGFREIAEFVASKGPRESLLYSGNHDAVVGLYLRILDPGFDRRLVPTNRLLYRFEQGSQFSWRETPQVTSPADVVSMIQRQSGCRWVAVENGARRRSGVLSEQYLRQALEGPEFERVRSFPVRTAYDVTRVDLYRFLGSLEEPGPVDLQFPSFSPRVFRGIKPIER
jgi:hypothetical protein